MALEQNPRGQVQELGRVLARRRWQILVPALYVFVFGVALAVIVPKKHVFETRIEIQERRNPEDFQLRNPQETAPARELSNVDEHIRHYNRVQGIVQSSKLWPDFELLPLEDQRRQIAAILADITVDLQEKAKSQGSAFIDILYRDVDPTRAEAFLTRLTETWIDAVREQDLATLKSELETLREGEKEAWNKRQETFSRYAEFARSMALNPAQPPNPNPGPGEAIHDFEFDRLDQLRRDHGVTQGNLDRARFDLAALEKRYADEPTQVPVPVPPTDPHAVEIARLGEEIEALRAELERLTPRNSRYARIERDIAERELEIDNLKQAGREEALHPEFRDNPFKDELRRRRDDLATQITSLERSEKLLGERVQEYENRIDQRTVDYARLMMLWSSSEESTKQHELALDKVNEKEGALRSMEAAYGRKPYESVSPPQELGIEPSGLLLALFGLLAGLALGVVVAFFLEYGGNAYRSVGDLAGVLSVPVLGSVGRIVTRDEERRARFRRLGIGVSSALILGSVACFTGVWALAPHLLPLDVERAIEGLRSLWM